MPKLSKLFMTQKLFPLAPWCRFSLAHTIQQQQIVKGQDRGSQYRSIAFHQNETEREIIQDYIALLEEKEIFSSPIVTEVSPLEKFYFAEEYHQDYEKLNPRNPYVQNVSIPRLRRFQKAYPELLKENH